MTPEPASREYPRATRRVILGLLAVALLGSGWALTRGWRASLRDAHEFRQLQTALTAYYFNKEGVRLAYETPVLGPPWSIPMELPLYQAVVAGVSRATRLPLEQCGRLVSIFFFYAALPGIWLLLRPRLPGAFDPLPAIAALLLCPLYLFYSRAFMIESTALCLAVWFAVCLDRALERAPGWALAGAWVCGAFATTTKITTFAAFWIAAALIVLDHFVAQRRAGATPAAAARRTLGGALLAASIPVFAGLAWVGYSDRLKELNPYGHFITSTALRPFNFGTLAQRSSYEWWRALGYITSHQVLAWPGLVVLGAGLWFSPAPYRRVALACVLCYPGGALLFANLYYVHDYYSYASAGFLAVALGVASAGLLHSPRVSRAGAALLFAGALAGQFLAFGNSYYEFYRRPNAPVPPEAAIVRAVTPPDDVIAGFGFDWNCVLPYYSERRAIMPFDSHTGDFALLSRSLAGLGPRRVTTLLLARQLRDDHALTDVLLGKLDMCAQPIARTEAMDIYVRRDRAAAAVQALMARPHWPAELNLKPDAQAVVLTEAHDLTSLSWLGTVTSLSPPPFRSMGQYPINYLDGESGRMLFTQAPTEIHFRPPAGSCAITAVGGMLPAAYAPPNDTPGVRIVVFEELADGTRRPLFDRLLMPVTEPHDRGDVTIEYRQEQPFTGTLVFAHYPVPSGNVSFSWSYWKRILIR